MTDRIEAGRNGPVRVAYLVSHPIQYQAPLFRALAGSVDLTVFFCHRHGVTPTYDREFGRVFQYDVPLLEGYRAHVPFVGQDRILTGDIETGAQFLRGMSP